MPRPHFTPGKEPVPTLQKAGWAPGPGWKNGKTRPHRDLIPDRPVCRQSLYGLSYPAHSWSHKLPCNLGNIQYLETVPHPALKTKLKSTNSLKKYVKKKNIQLEYTDKAVLIYKHSYNYTDPFTL